MSKRILFLYSDLKYKNDILECETVLKEVLRKFRKTAVFSYRQIDLSPSAQAEESRTILEDAASCDAVIWNGGAENFIDERIFAANGLGVFAAQYLAGGSCICTPLSSIRLNKNSETISLESRLSLQDIQKTFSISSSLAKRRKRSLVICTDDKSPSGKLIFREYENAWGNDKSITVHHRDFNSLIWECTYKLPVFDVLLTTEEKADIILMHTVSRQRFPSAAILWHCPGLQIYRRAVFPDEEMSNAALASLLFVCANAFIDELREKSAGEWLRRSTTLALDQYGRANHSDFLKEVLRQINTPIRNRQVNSNDSKD